MQAGDGALAEAAATALAADPDSLRAAAGRLAQRGELRWAAMLFEKAGWPAEAALAWESAGELTRAAALFEDAGDPARAARALESALRRDPCAIEAALRLGALLIRFEKDESGLRSLQRVPPHAPERRQALIHMIGALERLGLGAAASTAAAELSALGGALPEPGEDERPEERDGLLHGRYEVLRQVASSARARLIEGVDRATSEHVAIKLFAGANEHSANPEDLVRFGTDMRALRALNHPAIAPIRDFHERGPTLVLAWMEGGSLEQMLSRGPIAPARAAEIACSILTALGAAHHLGILHCDVKAANVLFDATGAARLSDFGQVRIAETSTTVTAGDFGALGSMSPEQRHGHEVTARSDIFAVGILLNEMLTGQKPGPAAHRRKPSEAHGGLGPQHDALVAQMTATDARTRPADALEARERLISLRWPTGDVESERIGERWLNESPVAARLERREDGCLVDLWTGRCIERVPLSDTNLARARAFAQADHRALQPVLRVDREGGFVWLDGSAGALSRALTPADRARLTAALAAVQAAGGGHLDLGSSRLRLDAASEVLIAFDGA